MRTIWFAVAAVVASIAVGQSVTPIKNGVSIKTTKSGTVRLTIESSKAFRISVGKDGPVAEDPYVALPDTVPSFKQASSGSMVGISVDGVGSILLDPDSTQFQMTDSTGKAVATSAQLLQPSGSGGNSTCDSARPGYDARNTQRIPEGGALSGMTQATCCKACDSHPDCKAWVFATSNPSQGDNCWLLASASDLFSSSDRVFGGQTDPPTPMPTGSSITFDASSDSLFYGSGAGQGDAGTLPRTSGYKLVQNRQSNAPLYWSSDGYSAMGVQNAQWTGSDSSVMWTTVTDLYIWAASSVDEHTKGMYSVTGAPAMPPRWALGFLACRWGWNTEAYINATLPQFRNGDFPITGYISDFSWFTTQNDYNCPGDGWSTYEDFSFSNATYPNPKQQLSYNLDTLHMRFMGIRKPRLCNSDLLAMAKSKGWLIPDSDLNGRNLNFSLQAVKDWYAQQQLHYLEAGVAGFWNDEGEVYYFMFYDWNLAQVQTLETFDSSLRFYSINRAFTPGMHRSGVTVWTGDINPSWQQLQITPGYMSNWGIMGAPYVTCDIGGFTSQTNALLLSRWYQAGVFLPIMRVHSTESATPHFPFDWPTDAANSMRDSLDLRFQLLPTLNSLAYQAYSEHTLMMRPLMADFFSDPQARDITMQWLVGSTGVMVAPVMNEDNSSSTYFPAGSGTWYDFNATSTHSGGDTVQITNAGLDYIPIYARAGTVLPLGPVIQDQFSLPGGPLTVHVYAGEDGSFTLVEDDGDTQGYTSGAIRSTALAWDDSSKTLSWTASGSFSGSTIYTQVQAKLFASGASGPVVSELKTLGASGSISF